MPNPKKTKATAAPKEKKAKLVRDSFTIPKDEYAALETLKGRALKAGMAIKKSELLRAGLMALGKMGEAEFKQTLAAVPTLKTGRPTQAASAAVVAVTPKPAAAPAPAVKKPATQAKVAAPASAPAAKTPVKTVAKPATAPAPVKQAKRPLSPAKSKAPAKKTTAA